MLYFNAIRFEKGPIILRAPLNIQFFGEPVREGAYARRPEDSIAL